MRTSKFTVEQVAHALRRVGIGTATERSRLHPIVLQSLTPSWSSRRRQSRAVWSGPQTTAPGWILLRSQRL